GGGDRLVTGRGAAAAREQPEAVVQARGHAVDTDRNDARRGELDRQRHPIEVPANGGCCRRDAALGGVSWLRGLGPRHEEPDRGVPEDVFRVRIVFRGHLERRDPGDVLARGSQWLTAGGPEKGGPAGAA